MQKRLDYFFNIKSKGALDYKVRGASFIFKHLALARKKKCSLTKKRGDFVTFVTTLPHLMRWISANVAKVTFFL